MELSNERGDRVEALVSIVVPIYNAEKFLTQTIESVLNQTYSNYELILVNDGSKDNSLDICNKYAEIDSRIRVISQHNQGAGVARNTGISTSKGKYVMFLDADDTYEPNIVSELVSKIEETASDLAICGYYVTNETEKKTIKTDCSKKMSGQEIYDCVETLCKKGVFNSMCNKIFLRSIIEENTIRIDSTLIVGEDFRFVLDYFDKSESISFVDKPLYNYKMQNSYTTRRYRENEFECRRKNAAYYISFCEKHNLHTNCYFQYIKLIFSTCIQMNNKSCTMSRSEKRDVIRKILDSDEMRNALSKAYAEDRYSAVLIRIAKTNNVRVIMLFSKLISFVKRKRLVRWNRVSI